MTIKYNGISTVTKLINSVKTRPKTHNFSVDKANKLQKYHTTQKYKLFFLTFHLLHRCATPDIYFKQNLQVTTMQVSLCYFLWIISRIF